MFTGSFSSKEATAEAWWAGRITSSSVVFGTQPKSNSSAASTVEVAIAETRYPITNRIWNITQRLFRKESEPVVRKFHICNPVRFSHICHKIASSRLRAQPSCKKYVWPLTSSVSPMPKAVEFAIHSQLPHPPWPSAKPWPISWSKRSV